MFKPYVINACNVNEALPLGLQLVATYGRLFTSRGMETLEYPGPVMTCYRHPDECVLFDPLRDANPFFHFIEALWILAGDNRVAPIRALLERIGQYSDDGDVFHGAYGHRLRHAFQCDQIEMVVDKLKTSPDTRQAVLSIWHPTLDLGTTSKDIPCNDMVMFSIRDRRLHMTVNNRSNDVIYGAYGANAVQFSFLQQYVAARLSLPVGTYTQVSNSFHVYLDNPFWKLYRDGHVPDGYFTNPYESVGSPLMFHTEVEACDAVFDMTLFCDIVSATGKLQAAIVGSTSTAYKSQTFKETVLPMICAYLNWKNGNFESALDQAKRIELWDWRVACTNWVSRRQAKVQA